MNSSSPEITEEGTKLSATMLNEVMPLGTDELKSTSIDVRDMWRMGKVQELKV